jgi:hypothetical protein
MTSIHYEIQVTTHTCTVISPLTLPPHKT